jgi:hypothetical protein
MTSVTRHRFSSLLVLTTLCVLAPGTAAAVGVLENPGDGSFASGVGLFSGWHCDANRIAIRVDDFDPIRAAYGTARGDTESVCGDSNNGFVLLFNYSLFGDGEHTAVALADGVEFGRATFTVATFGTSFLRDADDGVYTLPDFPADGVDVALQWQQGAQNFVITGRSGNASTAAAPPAEEDRIERPAAGPGSLELPGAGSFVSGIGLFSGWYCDADKIEVRIDGGPLFEAGYGTARGDTEGVCGDSNNGFGLLFNYNLLGDGPHLAVAYADGVEFGRASFTVTTLGSSFARGLERSQALGAFPELGSNIIVTWQQGAQNFVVTDVGDAQSVVEAGELAKAIGIGAYAVRIDDSATPPISVEVRTPPGGILGRATIDFPITGALWSFVGSDAITRTFAIDTQVLEDGSITTQTALSASGLTLVKIVQTGPGGSPVETLILETALPAGAPAPSVGGIRAENGGQTAFFALVQQGEPASTDAQELVWLDEVGLGELAADSGATYLVAAATDPNLAAALQLRGAAVEPGTSLAAAERAERPANLLGAICEAVQTKYACCDICTLYTPDLLPLGVLYSRFCACCGNLTNLSAIQVAQCVSRRAGAPLYTDEQCRQQLDAPKAGFVVKAVDNRRECKEVCDEQACRAACASRNAPPPPAGTNSCSLEGLNCICADGNPAASCAAQFGQNYCGTFSTFPNGGLNSCSTAKCGNGTVDLSCFPNPQVQEVCDPSAARYAFRQADGCTGNTHCAADCKSCIPCECQVDGDCPSAKRCNPKTCACEAKPSSCATDEVDLALNPGSFCDPRMSGRCARGLVCDAATCRCKPQGTCGDGKCDAAAGEQATGTPSYCPADCAVSCGDGKCSVGGGERNIFSDNYCPADCPENQCCVTTGGCPSEQLFECPGECCCCGSGAVCRLEDVWTCGS